MIPYAHDLDLTLLYNNDIFSGIADTYLQGSLKTTHTFNSTTRFEIVEQPKLGTLGWNNSLAGKFIYSPIYVTRLTRTDNFTYRAVNEYGESNWAVVNIEFDHDNESDGVLKTIVGIAILSVGASLDGLPSERMMGWLVFCVDVVGRTLDGFDPTSRGELEPRLDRRVALDTDKQIALLERDGSAHPEYMPESERPLQNPCERFESIGFLGLPDWLLGRVDRLEADQFELLEARYGLAREQPLFLSELCARFERSQRSITSDLARILSRLHQ